MEKPSLNPNFLRSESGIVVQNARQKTSNFFSRNLNYISPDNYSLILENEVRNALLEYGVERLDGHENDQYSKQPGLTAYLTKQGLERALEQCKSNDYEIPKEQVVEILPDLFALHLPNGIYSMGMGGAQFYQEAGANWDVGGGSEKPFALGYERIVRIEGVNENELWQNDDFDFAGTPKLG